MRTTKRLRERALLASLSVLAVAPTSCSSSDRPLGTEEAFDASNDSAIAEDVVDAGTKGAAVVDAAPLPIRCEAPPCAVALSTTPRGTSDEEGYCALLSDGTVACWGGNSAGQLGQGETSGPGSAVAVRVPGLAGITAIDHTCAVTSDGAVWCWGRGPFIENEVSATSVTANPVRVGLPGPAEKVAVSTATACAVLTDKSVVCWGSNGPSLIGPDVVGAFVAPRKVELPVGVKSMTLGWSAFALYENGRILSWGETPGVGRVTPFDVDAWPSPLLLEHVTMIDTIDMESCAVANGIGWCWGEADRVGLLYNPNPLQRALPAAVDTPEPITRIATSASRLVNDNGRSVYEKHRWCATSVSGALYCWGLNNAGQAGDGTKEFAIQTVRVEGLPAPAAEVKIMPYSTCAILTNGKVYCWGNNSYGQLGAGLPRGSVVTPVEVKLP
jgi:alpha-tubulin suppressor-like RCC1 family protein